MPYTYKVIPFTVAPQQRMTRFENLNLVAAEMERVVNEHAAVGWEFTGVEQVQLGDFQTHFDVLVFRAERG